MRQFYEFYGEIAVVLSLSKSRETGYETATTPLRRMKSKVNSR
jgi:hypothetical protein